MLDLCFLRRAKAVFEHVVFQFVFEILVLPLVETPGVLARWCVDDRARSGDLDLGSTVHVGRKVNHLVVVKLQRELDCIACQALRDGDGVVTLVFAVFEELFRLGGRWHHGEVMAASLREVELVEAHLSQAWVVFGVGSVVMVGGIYVCLRVEGKERVDRDL